MRARTGTSLREAALTVGAGLGLLCVLLAVAAPLLGVRLLVFESGSMSPTVETGGLALTRTVAADDVTVGDIVSVIPPSGVRVTHRIVDIDRTGGQTMLTLQGDANQAPDPQPYPVTEADRVLVHVNHLGFVVDALASPYAMFLGGAFVAGLLALAFRGREARPATRGNHRTPVVGAIVVVALVGGGLLVPSRVAPTTAAFTDTPAVPTGDFLAGALAAPASISCVEQGGLFSGYVDLSWTAQQSGARHRITLTSSGTTVTLSPDVLAGTNTRRLMASQVAGLLSVGGSVMVRLYATAGDSWISSSFAQRTVVRTSVLGLGLDIRC